MLIRPTKWGYRNNKQKQNEKPVFNFNKWIRSIPRNCK